MTQFEAAITVGTTVAVQGIWTMVLWRIFYWFMEISKTAWTLRHVIQYRLSRGESIKSIATSYKVDEASVENIGKLPEAK